MRKSFGLATAVAAIALIAGACSTRANLMDEYGTDYLIEVHNPHSVDLDVSAHIGSSAVTALGRVPAGATMRFAIMDPPSTEIELMARGGGTSFSEDVDLRRGEIVRVVLDD